MEAFDREGKGGAGPDLPPGGLEVAIRIGRTDAESRRGFCAVDRSRPGRTLVVLGQQFAPRGPIDAIRDVVWPLVIEWAARAPGDPAQWMPDLDRAAASHPGTGFLTLFLGDYDESARVLAYLGAGLDPPLLRRAGGVLENLAGPDVPLGMVERFPWESHTLSLHPGDLLVALLDPAVRVDPADEDTSERVASLLASLTDVAPERALAWIARGLREHLHVPEDDVTLFVARAA